MKTMSVTIPKNALVTDEFGTFSSNAAMTVFAVAAEKEDCFALVDRYVGHEFGSFSTKELPGIRWSGNEDLKIEIQRAQRLLGSIKIKAAIEAHDPSGFKWLYVIATEGDKQRVYFEEVTYDDKGVPVIGTDHYKDIVKGLISQF